MYRTAEWRRDQDKRHKDRERRRSQTGYRNHVWGTETMDEALERHAKDTKRRVGRMDVYQGNKCRCEWCASKKKPETVDEMLDSWYAEDGKKIHSNRGRGSEPRPDSKRSKKNGVLVM